MTVSKMAKGDKVVLLGFTGIRLAEVTIAKATKKEFTVIKANGDEMIFNKETGIQTNVVEGKEKYANKIVDPADAPVPKAKKAKAPAKPKKAAKVESEPEVEEVEEDEEDEEEEEEEEKPAKKPAKKAPAKKAAKKKKVEEIEEEDDEEYEEL